MAMTMLQMAGATPTPATMADGILMIIDAQREYTDGLMPLPGVQSAIEALAVLLDKARRAGAPIVHVRHQSKGKAFNPASSGYEIVIRLRRAPARRSSTRDCQTRLPEPILPSNSGRVVVRT